MSLTSAYIDAGGHPLHALTAGSGPRTLFLFHETPLSAKSFGPAIALLEQDFRIVAFDTPGYGASAPTPAPPRLEDYAAILWRGILAMQTGPFAMAGIHTGASLCLEIARAHPDAPIRGLVLSGVPLTDPEKQAALNSAIAARAGLQDEATILRGWHDRARRWKNAPVELLIQAFADELQVFPRRDWALSAVMAYDVAPALDALQVPTLLLNGVHDSLAAADIAVARRYPKLESRMLADAGGQLPWSAADLYVRHVRDFLLPKFASR